jgi:hypothetical protein
MDGRLLVFALTGAALLIRGPGPETRALAKRVAEALRAYSREQAAEMMRLPVGELDAQLNGETHISLKAIARLPTNVYLAIVGTRSEQG